MFSGPKKEIKTESVAEAQARGVEIKRCPSIPAKRPFELEKNYKKRVKTVAKIDTSHIPEDLRHLVAEIK